MIRLFLALVMALLVGLPAMAQNTYLIFKAGEDRSGDQWRGDVAPVPGVNVPAGSVVKLWSVQDGNVNPQDYRLDGQNLVLDPPSAQPVVIDPNTPKVLAFQTAIFNDNDLPIASRMAIADKFPLINQFMSVAPVQMTMYWAGLKMGAGTDYPWLTPEMIQKVEGYAEQYHIPLVAPAQ